MFRRRGCSPRITTDANIPNAREAGQAPVLPWVGASVVVKALYNATWFCWLVVLAAELKRRCSTTVLAY
jgi:hypothetical protein